MTTLENSTILKDSSQETCFFFEATPPFTETVRVSFIVTCVLNVISAIFAVSGNGIVLISLWRTPSLHTPSNVLLSSLVISDFLTGLVLQPLVIGRKLVVLNGNVKDSACLLWLIFDRLMWWISPVTFLSLVGISIERFLALSLHLRYRTVVTMQRMEIVSVGIWLISATIPILELLGLPKKKFNYLMLILILLGMTVIIFCSVKIFKIIQRHETKINSQTKNQEEKFHGRGRTVKLKRSSVTMCLIMGIFILCYLPFFCCMAVQSAIGFTSQVRAAQVYCGTIVLLNSSLNVLIYCARIGEIRMAMKRKLQRYSCLGRNVIETDIGIGQSSFQVSKTVRKQETVSEMI